jgi:hypothetical protein
MTSLATRQFAVVTGAQQGFDALMSGEQEVFSESLSTEASGVIGSFMPDSVKASMHEKMAKHGSADK